MRLLFIIYFVAELFVIVKFGAEFGFLSLLAEIILSALFGLFILISQRNVMTESFDRIFRQKESVTNFLSRSFFRLIGGVLLVLPGILGDILGIVFFVISLFFIINRKRETTESSDDETIIDAEIIESSELIEK